LFDQSEDLTTWTSNLYTKTNNQAISPDGTLNAASLVPNVGTTTQSSGRTVTQSAGNHVCSVFAKPNGLTVLKIRFSGSSYQAFFNLTGNGSVASQSNGTASISKRPDGWYRCVFVINDSVGETAAWQLGHDDSSNVDGTNGFYIWGMQVEAGSFLTSYIPTSGSTVTRSADAASMTGTNFSSWYNQGEGSFFAESKLLGYSNFAFTASVNGSDGYIDAPHRRQTDSVFYSVLHGPPGNTNQVLLVSQTTSLTSTSKAANAFRVNDYAYCLNGGTVLVDNLLNLPTPTSLSIGGQNGNYLLNGHISRLTYYSTRLPDATLQALTL
jgi:hypothetical protein